MSPVVHVIGTVAVIEENDTYVPEARSAYKVTAVAETGAMVPQNTFAPVSSILQRLTGIASVLGAANGKVKVGPVPMLEVLPKVSFT